MRTLIARVCLGASLALLTLAVVDVPRATAAAKEPPAGNVETGKPVHAEKAGDSHAEGEAHQEGVPLSFKADLAFWSAVTFVLFLLLLSRFAWKPLIAALDQREGRVRGDIAAAESARMKAEQLLAEHSKRMSQVQEEIRAMLAEARRDGDQVKQEIVTTAQKEAEAAKQRALTEISRARDSALKDLFDVMASEVAHATEHVLGRSVNAADQDRLIGEALAQIPRRS